MSIEFRTRPPIGFPPAPARFSSSREVIHDLLKMLAAGQRALVETPRRIRPLAQLPRSFPADPIRDPNGVLASDQIHPALAEKIATLLELCRSEGLSVMVWEGYRDSRRQNALFTKGGVTRAGAGKSWHNYGLAADIVFFGKDGKPSWNDRHDWEKLGRIGKSLGLSWGGDFKSLKDYGHFEWHPGISIGEAQAIARKMGWRAVWERVP